MKQFALFDEPVAEYRLGGGPPEVQRRFALAFTEPVMLDLLAVAAARPGEWLGWSAFREPMERYQIGFCMGHVLSHLARAGRLQVRDVYLGKGLGAEQPGNPAYRGYKCEWAAV